MNVSKITVLANGDMDTELALLQKEVENNTYDIEILIRLSQLHREKGNFKEAWDYLIKAEKELTILPEHSLTKIVRLSSGDEVLLNGEMN
jgi:hypothetical protein